MTYFMPLDWRSFCIQNIVDLAIALSMHTKAVTFAII